MKSFKLLMSIVLLICGFVLNAQQPSEMLSKDDNILYHKLGEKFKKFEIFTFDGQSFNDEFRSTINNRSGLYEETIQLGSFSIDVELEETYIVSDNYVLSVFDGNQVQKSQVKPTVRTYRGFIKGGTSMVTMTVDDGFLYGFFEEGNTTYYFEPAFYYDKDLNKELFVIYNFDDVKEHPEMKCAAEEMGGHQHHDGEEHSHEHYDDGDRSRPCEEVEYAIATDYSMFQKYGSVLGVQNRNIGVVNNLQTNYIDVFSVDYMFLVVQQYIVSCSGCDPWTSSTNSNTLLDDFTDWGPSGFSERHDVATLWSNRDFNGSTIGLAWLNATCGSHRYNICQDFTSNAQFIRVLVAHELGHNFGTGHDAAGSNTIMAPSVTSATVWSNSSVNQVNSYMNIPYVNCTTPCPPPAAPVADFSANVTSGCVSFSVQFSDNSTNSPNGWYWEFPGGTPSTSTQQNPLVTYHTQGIYDVTLVASNSVGSDETTKYNYIVANDFGPLDIELVMNDNILTVINNSDPTYSYSWDFGDGYFSSEFAPVHEYSYSGDYSVTLSVEGECGYDFVIYDILAVVPIVVDFEVGNTEVCVGDYVSFYNNTSGDAVDFLWTFEGGTPATSTDFSPVIVYNTVGVFDVSLMSSNQYTSDSKTISNYITVLPNTVADFDFVVNGDVVEFINNSQGANDYFWDFGDGTNSNEFEPTKTYTTSGNFTVTLHAYGQCGTNIVEVNILISLDVSADFSINVIDNCVPGLVQFTNESTGDIQDVLWVFEGGTPATSTEMNPIVTYNQAGQYDVTLTVSNPHSDDVMVQTDAVTIGDVPVPSFDYSLTNGNIVNITNNSTNFNTVQYNMGDGTILNTTHVVDYTYEPGQYQITITLENDCGTSTTTYNVVVEDELFAFFNFTQSGTCTPVTVNYSNLSTGNITSYNWTFPGGTPATSQLANPTVTYSSPGTYSATLVVSDGLEQSTYTVNNAIEVNEGPHIHVEFEQVGNKVTLTSFSTNYDSLIYDFGNGHIVYDEEFVEYTYPQYGNYIISVTAINECGEETLQFVVVDNTPPVADFVANEPFGCVPHTVHFQNLSSQHATSFVWSFEGGTPVLSSEVNPVVVYNTPGTFDVRLIAIGNESNDTILLQDYIIINNKPLAAFTFNKEELQVTFNNLTTNGNTYHWDFGDGNTSDLLNPVHLYEEEGIYSVTLISSNECGSDTITRTVNLLNIPVSIFGVAGSTSGCSPFEVQFSDLSEGEVSSYLWLFEGGTPSTSMLQNPLVTYNTSGQYDVTLITTNSIGSDTLTVSNYINVYDIPSEVVVNIQKTGLNVNFTAVPGFANYTYTWDFGDGKTGNGMSVFHSYDFEGEYFVTLHIQNQCGEYSQEFSVNVSSLIPVGNFSIGGTSGCVPLVVDFVDETINNPTSWLWSFPGGIPSESTEPNPTVTYNQPGNYTVTLTVSNELGSHTRIRNNFINVGNEPRADYTFTQAGSDVIFTNTSNYAYWYQWDFGDGNSSVEINPTHTYADGEYIATLIATNGCGSDTITKNINILTSTYNLSKDVSLTLYPNPTNGDFFIEMNDGQNSIQDVELLDLFGRSLGKVHTGRDHQSSYKYRITPMSIPMGTTIVKIGLADGTFVFKKLIFVD